MEPEKEVDRALAAAGVGSRVLWGRFRPGVDSVIVYERECNGRNEWGFVRVDLDHVRVFPFPEDPKLEGLRRTATADGVSRFLVQAEKREKYEQGWGNWELLRYRPEKMCVLRGRTASPEDSYVVRYYEPEQVERIVGLRLFLEHKPAADVRIPRVHSYRAKHSGVLENCLSGRPLTEVLLEQGPEIGPALAATGAALARWHSQRAPQLSRAVRGEERLSVVASAVDALTGGRLQAVRLAQDLEDLPWPRLQEALTLGGLRDGSVVVSQDGMVGFTELDSAGADDPYWDLARFCACLDDHRICGRLTPAMAEWSRRLFLESYAEARGVELDEVWLRRHCVVALLRQAMTPLERWEEDWRRKTKEMIESAWQVMED